MNQSCARLISVLVIHTCWVIFWNIWQNQVGDDNEDSIEYEDGEAIRNEIQDEFVSEGDIVALM